MKAKQSLREVIPHLGEAPIERRCSTPSRNAGSSASTGLVIREKEGSHTSSMQGSSRYRYKKISQSIRRAWQLTPAEARSASALALGRTPREIAVAHAVSIHTVRTHLKRAMSKAGVHSQAALVASVYALVGS
jgi:DNA-binding CsgD family transcriptional regulator